MRRGGGDGLLREVVSEKELDTDQPEIEFKEKTGRINADLTVGVDVTSARPLRQGEGLCTPGMKLHGDGFIISPSEAQQLGLGKRDGLEKHVRQYRNGRDLTARPRGVMVIDLYGLTSEEVRKKFPEVYQHVKAEVKEKIKIDEDGEKKFVGRDWNKRQTYKDNWWIFGEPRSELRSALANLKRYVATVETMQHRSFIFLDEAILPDNRLIIVATQDAALLGILSSRIHVHWTLSAGGTLEDRPTYTKSSCFDRFPFPQSSNLQTDKIRSIAEELDAHRKSRQQEHPDLTLTQMYNVLEKLKADTPLDEGDEEIKKKGLVLILKELHEKLDEAVFEAYGWPATLTDEQILEKLVALNHERAEEEKRGQVRWLRPDYQIPRFGKQADKQAAKEEGAQATIFGEEPADTGKKVSFPIDAVEQTAAVFAALAATSGAADVAAISARFKKTKNLEKQIGAVLASLARLGHVATKDGRHFEIRRVA